MSVIIITWNLINDPPPRLRPRMDSQMTGNKKAPHRGLNSAYSFSSIHAERDLAGGFLSSFLAMRIMASSTYRFRRFLGMGRLHVTADGFSPRDNLGHRRGEDPRDMFVEISPVGKNYVSEFVEFRKSADAIAGCVFVQLAGAFGAQGITGPVGIFGVGRRRDMFAVDGAGLAFRAGADDRGFGFHGILLLGSFRCLIYYTYNLYNCCAIVKGNRIFLNTLNN